MDEKLDFALKYLNDYLKVVIENNYKCQHCIICNENICFFASECVANDFTYYKEGD